MLSLDDDIAAFLDAEAHRKGRPFDEVLNEHLRQSLDTPIYQEVRQDRVSVPAKALGARPDVDLDDIEGLLEKIDTP